THMSDLFAEKLPHIVLHAAAYKHVPLMEHNPVEAIKNNVIATFYLAQIAAGGPVTVTHPEATRFFMTIPEAVQLVLMAGAMGEGGEVFLLQMGEAVRIVDLARKMIELSGLQIDDDIRIVFTGLRPGEKLHEELKGDREEALPTTN